MKKSLPILLTFLVVFSSVPTRSFALESDDIVIPENYKVIEVMESETVTDLDSITIEGITYGPEDGVELHSMVFSLEAISASDIPSDYSTNDYYPYHNYKFERGSSYVQNTELGYLHYRGRAIANGNLFSGKRVIQAKITYKRGGSVLKQAVSNATYQSEQWKSGGLKTVYVTDSVKPNAPQTKMYYDFVLINRNAH